MSTDVPAPTYSVGVRALCEFSARKGDLDLRFTPSPSAQEGVVGHGIVARRRPSGYAVEVALCGEHRGLRVQGRADGYDAASNRLEEVKTYRGHFEQMPANHRHLHWAQAKVYGALLCERFGLAGIDVALVYFEIASQTETVLVESHSATGLRAFFEAQCERFIAWARQEALHRTARLKALTSLRFPHAAFRGGQRELAESVYRTAAAGRCLIAQAPTGIGKTIATLFPALKAWPRASLDKIYFLTAKGSGRRLAFDALARLGDGLEPSSLRIVELVARDKACEHPDKACHGESCPLAKGFYDRLGQARAAAIERPLLDQATLREVALDHHVCPYYLGQELVRWADVVIGDYNHYFDVHAILHASMLADQWRVTILVDEAHNLVERARAMYSARLERSALKSVRRAASPVVAKACDRLARRWRALERSQVEPYRTHPEVPADFAEALQRVCSAISDQLAESEAQLDANEALLEFHFSALHFLRLVDRFADHSICDTTIEPAAPFARHAQNDFALQIRNVIPAAHLASRFSTAHASVLFSATLAPFEFHQDLLGLPADSARLDVASPFKLEQLCVRIASRLSTRYRDRAASLDRIVDLMAWQFAAAPGNYLAFFSSFEYLQQALDAFVFRCPDIPVWAQTLGMAPRDRDAFLARFTDDGCGIAFAVLGGSFGEGIDLPGRKLIGAFVATLGLPPSNRVNETIRLRMQSTFGAGYEYTYLYPGIQKVVQAVGRVIRSEDDRGIVHLLDDRFDRADVRRLFPSWWTISQRPVATAPPAGCKTCRFTPE